MTDLLVAFGGLETSVVTNAIPPSVRHILEPDAQPTREGADVVLELGPWKGRTAACHIVPSLALLTPHRYAVRFEVAGRRADTWTPWVATTTLGDETFMPLPSAADGLVAEIDELQATPPVEAVRLRVRLRLGARLLEDTPWLVGLSLWDGAIESSAGPSRASMRLAVPARTQLAEPEAVRMRICSPTSVAMAMEYLGRCVHTMDLADAVFHAATDRYGVWPAAVRAAAAHGLPGYLLRFPDWDAVAWCLEHGCPIVASIRYSPGELTNAPLPETTGHLVVITGMQGLDILVNDPAAPTTDSVPRRYHRDELSRVWLERTGMGYVFFRADGEQE